MPGAFPLMEYLIHVDWKGLVYFDNVLDRLLSAASHTVYALHWRQVPQKV